jgi:hypothetical protein
MEYKDIITITFSSVSAIISILGAVIAVRNTNVNLRLARLRDLTDALSFFLEEVTPNKHHWENFKKKQYVSDRHAVLENKIIMLLNYDNKLENELIETSA